MDKEEEKVQKILNLEIKLEEVLNKINYSSISYTKDNPKEVLGMMFAFRIIENTYAIISLLKIDKFYAPINSILRSTLEAIVDLDNLVNIDGYLEYLNYLFFDQKLFLGDKKFIKDNESLKINTNQYKDLKEKLEKEIITKYGDKFFNKKNKINTSIKFKFNISKSLETYDTMYYYLCSESHNNPMSLQKSYMNNNGEFEPLKEIDLDDLDGICKVSIGILSDLSEKVFKLFNMSIL